MPGMDTKPTPTHAHAPVGLATTAQAVAFLSLSRTTLWRLERSGVLQPVRLGRTVRYRWSDLQRLAGEGGGQ